MGQAIQHQYSQWILPQTDIHTRWDPHHNKGTTGATFIRMSNSINRLLLSLTQTGYNSVLQLCKKNIAQQFWWLCCPLHESQTTATVLLQFYQWCRSSKRRHLAIWDQPLELWINCIGNVQQKGPGLISRPINVFFSKSLAGGGSL